MTVKVRGYGCSSVVKAVVLQFELAGHGLQTDIKRSSGGQWVVEAQVKNPQEFRYGPPAGL